MTIRNATTAIVQNQLGGGGVIPSITEAQVGQMIVAAGHTARGQQKTDRDPLLVRTLFDGGFRVSECLQLTPASLTRTATGYVACITRKGGRSGRVGLSISLVNQLHAYAWQYQLASNDRFFPIGPSQAWRICERACTAAGVHKPQGTGYCHVLRHSHALSILARTGNPRAVQDDLGHADQRTTLGYMKTLSLAESLAIRHGIDYVDL